MLFHKLPLALPECLFGRLASHLTRYTYDQSMSRYCSGMPETATEQLGPRLVRALTLHRIHQEQTATLTRSSYRSRRRQAAPRDRCSCLELPWQGSTCALCSRRFLWEYSSHLMKQMQRLLLSSLATIATLSLQHAQEIHRLIGMEKLQLTLSLAAVVEK